LLKDLAERGVEGPRLLGRQDDGAAFGGAPAVGFSVSGGYGDHQLAVSDLKRDLADAADLVQTDRHDRALVQRGLAD
jgi:hypothetical protein